MRWRGSAGPEVSARVGPDSGLEQEHPGTDQDDTERHRPRERVAEEKHLTVASVAKEAGLSVDGLRYHFAAKRDLLAALVDAMVERSAAVDTTLLEPLRERFREWQALLEDDGLPPAVATAVRLAIDGWWFAALLDLAAPACTLCRGGPRAAGRSRHRGAPVTRVRRSAVKATMLVTGLGFLGYWVATATGLISVGEDELLQQWNWSFAGLDLCGPGTPAGAKRIAPPR